jgi:hypothetical protein
MKKVLFFGLVCMFLVGGAFAYTRDARLDSNSIGLGFYSNPYNDGGDRGAINISAFTFEKMLDENSSVGAMYAVYEDASSGLPITDQSNEYSHLEISFNKGIYRNDVFASCWIFGVMIGNNPNSFNYYMPEAGVALSYKPFGFLTIRSNLVLSNMLSFGAAIDLPYNFEFSSTYYWFSAYGHPTMDPVCLLSYKI